MQQIAERALSALARIAVLTACYPEIAGLTGGCFDLGIEGKLKGISYSATRQRPGNPSIGCRKKADPVVE
jgi:hypothetical protein